MVNMYLINLGGSTHPYLLSYGRQSNNVWGQSSIWYIFRYILCKCCVSFVDSALLSMNGESNIVSKLNRQPPDSDPKRHVCYFSLTC